MQGENEKNHDLKGICEDAASKAQAWMLAHLKDHYRTETVQDPMKYYKWPLALAKRGKDAEAVRLLNWIAQQCMTSSGDLVSERSGFHKEFYTYANLWLVLAAIKLGEKEFLEPSLDFLLHWHNEQTGGLITNPIADTENMTEDPLSTSFLGWAACELKDTQRANRVLAYLMHWIDQPLDDDRLWLRTSRDGTLINHLPEHADPSTYVIEMGEQDESYYFLGSVCFFLANYIRVFNKGAAVELADKIAGLLENIGPEALHTIWAAKVAPGCVALYDVTSDQRFFNIAKPVIDAVVKGQSSGGYWLKNGKPWVTVSAEQCYWLSLISERLP